VQETVTRCRDIAAERASLEAEIEGRTLCGALAETATRLAGRDALRWGTHGEGMSWGEFYESVGHFALGLEAFPFPRGSFVVLLTHNRPEHLIAHHAVLHAGGTPVTLYDALAAGQAAQITRHCDAALAVVEESLLPKLLEHRSDLPGLRGVIVVGEERSHAREGWLLGWADVLAIGRAEQRRRGGGLQQLAAKVRPNDLAALVYTSGTSGPPKGVMVTHRSALCGMASFQRLACWGPEDRLVSYLPLAHLSGHISAFWGPALYGTTTHLCTDLSHLPAVMVQARPTFFFGPPGVWEALRAAVGALPPGVPHSEVLGRLGLDQCRLPVTAAAPMGPELLASFHDLGLDVSEIWGMTECGVGTWSLGRMRTGTVGPTLPGVEARIAPDGELLVRSGGVAPGYYRDPERTAAAIDPEGWLHTEDLAEADEDGSYRILGRRKELFITPLGRNLSPVNLESRLKAHPLIQEAAVVGDGRPWLTALLVLDAGAAAAWAADRGLEVAAARELGRNADLSSELDRAVERVNAEVADDEQIRGYTLLHAPWTIETGELTPTLKIRRSVICEKYADDIEAMYQTR